MRHSGNHWLQRFRFWLERQLAKGTAYRLAFIAALIGLVSLVGGALAWAFGQTGALQDGIWWAFLRLSDSGYLGDDQGVLARTLALIITVLGYALVTGSLIAILSEWLGRQIRQLERGTTPVSMRHHIVVLGWTERTKPLLRELWASENRVRRFLARRGQRKRLRLVVLDNLITPELNDSLRHDPEIGPHLKDVILRNGSPLNREHLARTDPGHAAAIIVSAQTYQDGSITSDTETIKMLLALDQSRAETGTQAPYVVAELQDPDLVTLAQRAYQGPLELLPGDLFITHLLVQTLRNPGLSHIYPQMLTQRTGHSIFIQRRTDVDGARVGQLSLPDDVSLIGRVCADASVEIPLPDEAQLHGDDALILLAADYEASGAFTVRQSTEPATVAGLPDRLPVPPEPTHVIVIGWSRLAPLVLRELAAGHTSGVKLTLVSMRTVAEREELAGSSPLPACDHIVGDATRSDVWEQIPIETADRVLFLSSDRLATGEEADARSMVAYLHLERRAAGLPESGRPHVLIELADPANERLLLERNCEFLVSPLVMSHLLVQVALRRELAITHNTLLNPLGPEIRVTTAGDLALLWNEQPVTEGELRHWLRALNAQLLGRFHSKTGVRFGVIANEPVAPDDRVIVLLPGQESMGR